MEVRLVLDMGEGTTVSDAALLMNFAMSCGLDRFSFTAAR